MVFASSLFVVGTMQAIDIGVRFTKTFASTYKVNASIEESLLLDYLWGTPGVVSIDAIRSKHWKVAWFPFTSLMEHFSPVLTANMLTPVITEKEMTFKCGETIFYTASGFLVACFISLLFAWPRTHQLLPQFRCSSIMLNEALDLSDGVLESGSLSRNSLSNKAGLRRVCTRA
jgi:hypothetical protein